MFTAADHVAEDLVMNFTWAVVHAPAVAEFALPGMGITLYDPTPPHPEGGLGFRSSPNAQTIMPVDPGFALVLTPGPPRWTEVEADSDVVDEVNLRSYAWSDAALYGRSQKVVTDLRALARRDRARLAEFRPRPARLWITESEEAPRTGEFEFTGYGPDGEVRQRFVIEPGAFEGVEPFRG